MNGTATWRGRYEVPLLHWQTWKAALADPEGAGFRIGFCPSAAKRYFVAEGRVAVCFNTWSEI